MFGCYSATFRVGNWTGDLRLYLVVTTRPLTRPLRVVPKCSMIFFLMNFEFSHPRPELYERTLEALQTFSRPNNALLVYIGLCFILAWRVTCLSCS